MTPYGVAGYTLKHAGELWPDIGSSIVVEQGSAEVSGVGGAIDARQQRLDDDAGAGVGEVFTGIEKDVGVPCLFRVLIGHVHFSQRALIQNGPALAGILVADQIHYRADARVAPEAEVPGLPTYFAILDGEAGAIGL